MEQPSHRHEARHQREAHPKLERFDNDEQPHDLGGIVESPREADRSRAQKVKRGHDAARSQHHCRPVVP